MNTYQVLKILATTIMAFYTQSTKQFLIEIQHRISGWQLMDLLGH